MLLIFLSACAHKPASRNYELQGRVVAVDPTAHQLTIDHQDIPGLMKGMTMPFVVSDSDTWVFKAIAPGDQIRATLVLGEHAELRDVSFTKADSVEAAGASNLRIPQPGDSLPEVTLVDQDGNTIRLSQYRGRPLLLTFIYTSCPFPDFCPRISSNFREVLQQLHNDPAVFQSAQLLSVSVDPENDKPSVLRDYGKRYAGNLDPNFRHWQFASGDPEQVRKAADFFGLAYVTKDGQIVHGLRTVLIDKNGKIAKVYSGNDWKPEQAAADFVAASGR
jgi:protein SCO1/2